MLVVHQLLLHGHLEGLEALAVLGALLREGGHLLLLLRHLRGRKGFRLLSMFEFGQANWDDFKILWT